ncbi:MAG: right-handed parallel beta-helix repeat-containing protein, partial [Lentisphaerota bacterium]
VADPVHSPCIDTGDPAGDYAREPVPNGLRVNIGSFGDTWEASLSTNEWLLAVSYNDGGSARGTVPLLWESAILNPAATVSLDYSADNGAHWESIATNVPATDEFFEWASTNYHGSPLARWRLVLESNTSVWDQVDMPFNLRPLRLYVNDPFSIGDVFTTAPGDDTNTGVFSNAPKATVQALLNAYDLEYGDQVFIDTGQYPSSAPLRLDPADGGASSNWVTLRGTTNGTVLQCTASNIAAYSVYANNVSYVGLQDLILEGGHYGVYLSDAHHMRLSNIVVRSTLSRGVNIQGGWSHVLQQVEVCGGGSDGIYVSASSGNLLERCLVWTNQGYGLYLSGTSNTVRQCVIAYNAKEQIRMNSGPVRIYNSIVVADKMDQYCFYRAAGEYLGDFNDWRATEGAMIGYYAGVRSRLSDWQAGSGQDTNSMARDPLFVNPSAGDFHLQSTAGRYDRATLSWTNDAMHSPCIDAGDPSEGFACEPSPNGSRMNQGVYANTEWASKSLTTAWVRVMNYTDGGVARGMTGLRWTYGNLTGAESMNLMLSLDNGASWAVMGNAGVGAAYLLWDTSAFLDQPDALWALEGVLDTNVSSRSDRPFALNPFSYYANDTNITGDVFTTDVGDDRNDGTSSNRPMLRIQRLLDVYDLEPGATVYVDTGNYLPASEIEVSSEDGGVSNDYVRIKGSPNAAAGGAVMGRSRDLTANSVLHAIDTDYLLVEQLTITGSHHAVYMQSSDFCVLSNLVIRGAVVNSILLQDSDHNELYRIDAALGEGTGISLSLTDYMRLERSQIWGHGGRGFYLSGLSNRIEHCIIAYNQDDQLLLSGGTIGFWNNIVASTASNNYCFNRSSGVYEGDYNDYFTTNGALMGFFAGNCPSLSDWREAVGHDTNSLSHNPLFADAANGDFHLRSLTGRFAGGVMVTDTVHSPCIDAGNPLEDWATEPAPNGSRINMGPYGNTLEASTSDTNNWLLAVTYNDGGAARNVRELRWRSGLTNPAAVVSLEYSPDLEANWVVLASNVPAGAGVYEWATTNYDGSPFALWRVVSDVCTDRVDRTFQVRPFKLFVNDNSMVGDIYCTTNGLDGNTGASSNSPMATLARILQIYDLDYQDTVYIDTGYYPLTNDIVLLPDDGGSTNGLVHFIGSTNWAFGGSLFNRAATVPDARSLYLNGADYLHMKNLVLQGGALGMELYYAEHNLLENLQIREASQSGLLIDRGLFDTLQAIRVTGCGENGVRAMAAQDLQIGNTVVCSNRNVGVGLENSETLMDRCTVADNRGHQLYIYGVAEVDLRNSILVATNKSAYCLYLHSGSYTGDYNNLYAAGDAHVAYADGPKWALLDWQQHTAVDTHSLSHNPLFVNASAGDYHLRSGGGLFSPSIDAGHPAAAWTNEPLPNGGRLNQGAYGNTAEAELSDPNPWLVAVSCNQGGLARNSVDLRWNSNLTGGDTLRLEYSEDDGLSWTPVDAGVSPAQEYYRWFTTNRSATAKWRAVLESDTNLWDGADGSFILNPNRFYINDDSTLEDVYTTGPGFDTNRGASASTPMRALQTMFEVNDLEPGDTVLMDTGYYLYSNNITMTLSDAGASNRLVYIQGSTNRFGQRTVLDRALRGSGSYGLYLNSADFVGVSHLRFANGYYGLYLLSSMACAVSNCEALGQGGAGMYFKYSDSCTLAHSRLWGGERHGLIIAGNSNRVVNCVMHGNDQAQLMLESGSVSLNNSILTAVSSNARCIQVTAGSYAGDFNNLYTSNSAPVGYWLGARSSLLDWQQYSGQDSNSLSHFPRFVDSAAGDFHLRSMTPGGTLVMASGVWSNFAEHSACIDAGPWMGPITNEPSPNGGRINLGAYGDTAEASLSLTCAWVRAVSMNNGGSARGQIPLRWLAGNITNGTEVQLEYSRNEGNEWIPLVTNLPIESERFDWDSASYQGSPLALWRIIAAGVTDAVDQTFLLHPFVLYVNDADTNGDIYCSAPGAPGNDGVGTNSPRLNLMEMLASYDLEYLDTVYVDTGFYNHNSNLMFTAADAGSP